MPGIQDGDMQYFVAMIDANGDGRIEQAEFLAAAKSCLADEAAASRDGGLEVKDVLQRMSDHIRKNRVSAKGFMVIHFCVVVQTESNAPELVLMYARLCSVG